MTRKLKKFGPLYIQLADILRAEIAEGKYPVGSFFPTERAIGLTHDVTRITVRGALTILEKEHLVKRERGRGTQVARVPSQPLDIELFFLKWVTLFEDPLFANLCSGVVRETEAQKGRLRLTCITSSETIPQFLADLKQSTADGIIVLGAPVYYKSIIQEIESCLPTVVIGTPQESLRADILEPDFEGAMEQAIRHVHARGYRSLSLVGGGFSEEEGRDARNREAFERVSRELGYAPEDCHIWWAHEKDSDKPKNSENFYVDDTLFDEIKPPVAILATGATFAIRCLSVAVSRGYRVPEDVAIVSTQDSQVLPELAPAMTGVGIYGANAGRRAVELLKQRIKNPDAARTHEKILATLRIRESS